MLHAPPPFFDRSGSHRYLSRQGQNLRLRKRAELALCVLARFEVSEERQKSRPRSAGRKFERRGGNDRTRSSESASEEIRSQLPLLEKAFSQRDFPRQKVPLEEILKHLRPLHLTSIEQLDFSTRGRLLTTLLRVGRQPPPAVQVAQPMAQAPDRRDSSALEPSGDVAAEPSGDVAAEPR